MEKLYEAMKTWLVASRVQEVVSDSGTTSSEDESDAGEKKRSNRKAGSNEKYRRC